MVVAPDAPRTVHIVIQSKRIMHFIFCTLQSVSEPIIDIMPDSLMIAEKHMNKRIERIVFDRNGFLNIGNEGLRDDFTSASSRNIIDIGNNCSIV